MMSLFYSRFRFFLFGIIFLMLATTGCFSYSFTGASIPDDVETVYIPFFADQSSSGIGDLSDQLNNILIERFINQTRLQLADSRADADVVLEGSITSYESGPFSVTGEETSDQNEVTISVEATYQYTDEDEPEWESSFSGNGTYDPNENPIDGEANAAAEALEQLANNMFNDAVSDW